MRKRQKKKVPVIGAALRLWPAQAAVPCVNYTCKAYYIKRGHLLAGEMRPASATQSQASLLTAREMIAL